MKSNFKNKKLIVFDIDGTLTPSKAPADREMIALLLRLLEACFVAVISGGKYGLFKEQLVRQLPQRDPRLKRLYLFPTTATSFYKYSGTWKKIYKFELSPKERKDIKKAFGEVFKEIGYAHPKKTYGKVIEDRRTQVTFSALGQEVVAMLGKRKGVRLKEEWRKKNTPLKLKIAKLLQKKLPNLEVHAAGFTSIDVTRKGIDKAYGLRQIEKRLGIKIKDMLFVGDAIFPGGNDYAVVRTGVDYLKVKGPEDTKKIIKFLLSR
ncbi:MAG: HAD-IIB family hydrolase [bacterium]|nr:HAD-IIB family hydrolase [bacterium]